jgi:DNA-binding CsgD family transcriptional regulator
VFIETREPTPHHFSTGVISEIYGLTDAEAKLSAALANGHSLEEIAKQRNVTMATLRSQLKTCFRKTGTTRQAEVVKLILSGPAVFADSADLGKRSRRS